MSGRRATRPRRAGHFSWSSYRGELQYRLGMGRGRTLQFVVYAWSSGYHWALFETQPGKRRRLLHHDHVSSDVIDDLDDPYEAVLLAALEAYRLKGHR